MWTREPDHEEEHQNNGKGQKDISAPHHSPVSRIADTRIIFGAVGIQNLLDLSGHDLTLGDDDGPGGDNTLGRRNFRRVFGVHEFGHLSVKNEVRNNEIIDTKFPTKGIGSLHTGERGHKLKLGRRDGKNLLNRFLDSPLVSLYIDKTPVIVTRLTTSEIVSIIRDTALVN